MEIAEYRAAFPPTERTLPALLVRQAQRHGPRPLFRAADTAMTFADAPLIAAALAARLTEVGIGVGDRVALLCGNRAEFMQVYLGCAWLGAVCVPVNTASKAPQLHYLLKNSGAKLLVIEDDLRPALALVPLDDLALTAIWVIGAVSATAATGDRSNSTRRIAPVAMPAGPAAGDTRTIDRPGAHLCSPGDDLAILYTSGTTGPSKGVRCSHAQYFWWGAHSAELLGVRMAGDSGAADVLHTSLPLFHINALNTFMQALLTGSQQVVERRFSVSGFWASLQDSGATVTYLLGAMVPMLLSRPVSAREREHAVRTALGPGVPPPLHQAFRDRCGIELIDGYGSTETCFVIGGTAEQRRAGAMGIARDGFTARVVDGADNEMPPGSAGELVLRAADPFAFSNGYHGMAEQTVAAWRNLWFHTGDRVVQTEDGYFRFVDRLKEAIRRRGENISSFEVEQVLLSHPDIASAAAYPVASELAEDEVMVAIVLRDGCELAPTDLLDYCKPRLPYFALPRFIETMPELPRTENGKIRKFLLRERGVCATTWDRDAAGYPIR